MALMILIWGFEYIVVKNVLPLIQPLSLVFLKYVLAGTVLTIIKCIRDRKFPIKKNHIFKFIICALFGDILYYFSEYTSLIYLKVSTVTIILAFVPIMSMVIEFFLYKKKPVIMMIVCAFISVGGIVLVTGDLNFFSGELIGFLCAILAVICWNVFNFITEGLTEEYKIFDITYFQVLSAICMAFPFFVMNPPALSSFAIPEFTIAVLYLGLFSASFCFLVYVKAIDEIGSTAASMFSNFTPVIASVFGFIFLKEILSLAQLAGCVIVIVSGFVFILAKNKLEKNKLNP